MSYNLFLDDERIPKTKRDFVVVRSYEEAVSHVTKNGIPAYITFDHDLGENSLTGYDFTKWICDYIMSVNGEMFEWNVHSANPVGAENINSYLHNFVNFFNK